MSAMRVSCPNDLEICDRIVLPGVGHFDYAMKRLNSSSLQVHAMSCTGEENSHFRRLCWDANDV